MVDQALATVGHWLAWLLAFVLSIFAVIDGAMRTLMDQLHIPGQIQTVIIVLLTIVLIVAAVRLFGGVFRILLMVFLILLLAHVLLHGSPGLRI